MIVFYLPLENKPPPNPPRPFTQIYTFFSSMLRTTLTFLHTLRGCCTRSQLLHTLRGCCTRSGVAAHAPKLLHTLRLLHPLRSCCTRSEVAAPALFLKNIIKAPRRPPYPLYLLVYKHLKPHELDAKMTSSLVSEVGSEHGVNIHWWPGVVEEGKSG